MDGHNLILGTASDVINTGLRDVLAGDYRILGGSTAVEELPGLLPSAGPSILITSYGDGRSAARLNQLRVRRDNPRIIVLSALAAPGPLHECLNQGIEGYVRQEHLYSETIKEAIAHVGSGGSYLDPESTRILVESRNKTPDLGPVGILTDRQQEVLSRLRQGYNNRQIAQKLFISEETVKNHLLSIYDALGITGGNRRVKAATGNYT